jgi:ferredoxin
MIVAEQKPFAEITAKLEKHDKVIVAGCATCVAECHAGGKKETEVLASQLRIHFKDKKADLKVSECLIERQCEPEMVEEHAAALEAHDGVLSLACGIGVQQLAERFPDLSVYPGLNTTFLGTHAEPAVWAERCAACGDCILDRTAGVCPMARCSKRLLNGPCGGTNKDKCEVNDDIPCAWAEIVKRLKARGALDQLAGMFPAKYWSSARDGGPRRLVREDIV